MNNESKKILTKYDIITGLFCLLGMIPGLIYYNRMPERIPIHFDVNNQPNNYASKPFVVFALPLIMLAFHLLCCAIGRKNNNNTNPKSVEIIVRWIIPIITIVIESITVMYVMELFTNIGLVCLVLIGIILIAMGNYLPKTRPNRTFGIKFPWTLYNEEVWHKTHRLAGWTMVIGGIIIIITAFLNAYYICIATAFAAIILPVAYSVIISRKNA